MTAQTESEALREKCAAIAAETEWINHEHAGRYQMLLDRLAGENTEHGDCQVAKRLDELEGAIRDCMTHYVDILDNCLFPAYGLTSNLTPAQEAWRKKVRAWKAEAVAALKGGAL